jgi:hypothetical protein
MTRNARPGEDDLAVPELTDADWGLAAMTVLISAIPFGGHMANEFMRLVGSPIERQPGFEDRDGRTVVLDSASHRVETDGRYGVCLTS